MLERLKSAARLLYAHAAGKPIGLQEKLDLLYVALPDPWKFKKSSFEQERYRRMLEVLGDRRFHRALEFGCAEGVFTRSLAHVADRVVGVDLSEVALQRAHLQCADLHPQVTFRQHDFTQGPLDEPPFDLIVASEVLYFLDDVELIRQVGERLVASLAPGGWLLLVHMRLLRDDTAGHARTVSGFPHMGAATVHPILKGLPGLRLHFEDVQPLYAICVLEAAVDAPSS